MSKWGRKGHWEEKEKNERTMGWVSEVYEDKGMSNEEFGGQ